MAGDAAVVVAAVVISGLLFRYVTANGLHPFGGQAAPLIGTVTAGAAAVVALLSAVNARLGCDRGLHLIGYAWGFYALVVMPVSVLNAVPGERLLPGAGAASAAIFCLLFAVGLKRSVPRWWSGPRSVALGIVLALPSLITALVVQQPVIYAVDSSAADVLLLAGWGLLAGACVVRGWRRRSAAWWRMGFGLVLITAARSLLLIGTPLQFAVLRLIGFLVLMAAVSLHTRALVLTRRAAEAERADRLAAEERAAVERRHEIRNALWALSSVTTLMAPRSDVEVVAGGRPLTVLINEELTRLHELLDDTAPTHGRDTADVDAVLGRLVTLRRLAGMQITLDSRRGLEVALSPATLAQVVTNLLANCARHAAGAEVSVLARREGFACVIEITDTGPGLDPTASTVGDGLGLALSTRLLEAVGGTLELRRSTRSPRGTTVLLRLPTEASARSGRLVAMPSREGEAS